MNDGLCGPRAFVIVGGDTALELRPINERDYDALPKSLTDPARSAFAAVPIYYCRGKGIWPTPDGEVIIVQEVKVPT